MLLYSNLDLKRNQIINVVIHVVADVSTDIVSPIAGQIVYETSSQQLKFYNGSAWTLSSGNSYTVSLPLVMDGSNNITLNAATTSTPGSMSAADKTKLDNATATPTADRLVLYDANGLLSTGTPTGNTHAANKLYVDTQITNAIDPIGRFVGTFDFSTNLAPTTGFAGGTIAAGDYWVASVASTTTVPNVSPSIIIEVGDIVIADGAGNFYAIQRNIVVDTGVQVYTDSRSYTSGIAQTVTHNLGTEDITVQVYDVTTKELVYATVTISNSNSISVQLNGNDLPKSFKTVIVG